MSLAIRRQIDLAKARLQTKLVDVRNQLGVDTTDYTEQQLLTYRSRIEHQLRSLNSIVGLLNTQTDYWGTYLQSLHGNELQRETELFEDYSSGDANYLALMDEGREAIDSLSSTLRNVKRKIQLLNPSTPSHPTSDEGEDEVIDDEEDNAEPGDDSTNDNRDSATRNPTRTGHRVVHHAERASAMHNRSATNSNDTASEPMLYLPRFELDKFDGNILQWQPFWESFEASIHNNRNIPAVNKLHFLRRYLVGDARAAVDGFQVIGSNYTTVVDTLKRRFGQKDLIVHSLHTELMKIPTSNETVSNLRQTYENIERILRQLEGHDESLDHTLLLRTVESKFPKSVVEQIYTLKAGTETYDIFALRSMLDHLITLKEQVDRIDYENHFLNPTSNRSSDVTVLAASNAQQHTRSKSRLSPQAQGWQPRPNRPATCAYCKGAHPSYECRTYGTLQARTERAKAMRLCFNCLSDRHSMKYCRSSRTCRYCHRKHHSTLCNRDGAAQSNPANAPHSHTTAPQSSLQPRAYNNVSNAPQRNLQPRAYVNSLPATQQRQYNSNRGQPRANYNTNRNQADRNNYSNRTTTNAHPVLTYETPNDSIPSTETNQVPPSVTLFSQEASTPSNDAVTTQHTVLLLTTTVNVFNPHSPDNVRSVTALLDTGSEHTYITAKLMTELGLPTLSEQDMNVCTFGSDKILHIRCPHSEMGLQLTNGTTILPTIAVPRLTASVKAATITSTEVSEEIRADVRIVEPDLLIGNDMFWDLIRFDIRPTQLSSGYRLIHTLVGPVIGGRGLLRRHQPVATAVMIAATVQDYAVTKTVVIAASEEEEDTESPTLWRLDLVGIGDSHVTSDDQEALELFRRSIAFRKGRYHVKWPMKLLNPALPSNYYLCLGRLLSLLRRLVGELLAKYDAIIQEQLDKGIIEIVLEGTCDGPLIHYLPHHAVVTPLKTTTKVRIVYDASARCGRGKLSLNDCLYRGPVILPDIAGVLIRFFFMVIAIVSDIEKAFLQICLDKPDREVTRFLWLKDITRPPTADNIQIWGRTASGKNRFGEEPLWGRTALGKNPLCEGLRLGKRPALGKDPLWERNSALRKNRFGEDPLI
ncbi:Zinc knuckle family protein [Aphelenchoides avenae]|nr:Zinc knuckle family protein [Aphelenchus avenae]